jgi:DNA-cytosine methyltransferase
MNILSLFDGMSCGQIALNRVGIKYDKYFASEIDENGIQVTMDNYPNTTQLGDVTKIISSNLPQIDLLIGGSPCQGFSFAGKQLNFNDPRSVLFFEFVRLKNECKPKYFLLENVKMRKDFQDIISGYLGVEPIEINSSTVSAQDRKRLYWTNIPNITQPTNKNIYLKDVLDIFVDDSLFLSDTIASRYFTVPCTINKNKSCVIGKLSNHQGDRIFDINCKGSSLSASGGNNGAGGCNIIHDPTTNKLRKLSVSECERLQTVPENYTKLAKKTQRYKMLGNGWTVDVISHIFKNII